MRQFSDEVQRHTISVLGSSKSGKTSILLRFIQNIFNPSLPPTDRPTYLYKQITTNDQISDLSFIDTPGELLSSSSWVLYLRNIDSFLIIVDSSANIEEKENDIKKWSKVISDYSRKSIPGFVVFSKHEKINMPYKEDPSIEQLTLDMNLPIFYTSAKEGTGVKEMFKDIIKKIEISKAANQRNSIKLHRFSIKSANKPCITCCNK